MLAAICMETDVVQAINQSFDNGRELSCIAMLQTYVLLMTVGLPWNGMIACKIVLLEYPKFRTDSGYLY